jgi:FixJ family two-component response regulator
MTRRRSELTLAVVDDDECIRRGVPVVFITAHDQLDILAAVQRTHSRIRKPLDEGGLLDAIARATSPQT